MPSQHTCRHSSSGASAGVGDDDDSPALRSLIAGHWQALMHPLLHSLHAMDIGSQVTDNLSPSGQLRGEKMFCRVSVVDGNGRMCV